MSRDFSDWACRNGRHCEKGCGGASENSSTCKLGKPRGEDIRIATWRWRTFVFGASAATILSTTFIDFLEIMPLPWALVGSAGLTLFVMWTLWPDI